MTNDTLTGETLDVLYRNAAADIDALYRNAAADTKAKANAPEREKVLEVEAKASQEEANNLRRAVEAAPLMTNDTGETLDALYLEWKATKAGLESLENERREYQAKLDELLLAVRERWQTEHAEFLQLWERQLMLAAETENALRETVIAAYEANGRTNKQIAPGCSVRINTKLDYNAATALDFAKTHGICLKLDAKEFEKVAPTICPNLVTPIETVTAVLSSK